MLNSNVLSIIYGNLKKCISELNSKILVRGTGCNKTEYYVPELGRWINTKSMKSSLNKIGMTRKDYYDRYLSPYVTPPKCKVPGCNEYCLFKSISEGYTYTCSPYHSKVLGNITRNKEKININNTADSYISINRNEKPYNHSYYNNGVLNCNSLRVVLSQVYKFNTKWIHRVISKIKRTTINFIGVNRILIDDNRLKDIELPMNPNHNKSIVKHWEFNYSNDQVLHNFRLSHPFIYRRSGKVINTYLVPFSLYRGSLWNWIYVFIYSLDTPKKRLEFLSIKDSKGFIIAYYIPELYSTEPSRSTNQAILRDSGGLYDTRMIYNKNILLEDYNYEGPICELSGCNNVTKFRSMKFGYKTFCCNDHEFTAHKTQIWKDKRSSDTKLGFIKNNVDFKIVGRKISNSWRLLPEDSKLHKSKLISQRNKENDSYKNLHSEKGRINHLISMKNLEVRLKMSNSAKKKIENDRDGFIRRVLSNMKSGYRSGYATFNKVCTIKGDHSVVYDSLYELAYFSKIDNDNKIISAIVEPFYIEYVDEGVDKWYYPDIIVTYENGHKELLEIKPTKLLNDRVVKLKQSAAQIYCKEHNIIYKFITETEVFSYMNYNEALEYHRYLKCLSNK